MIDYLIVVRDDRFWLVGPFANQKAAADWGAGGNYDARFDSLAWMVNNPTDDPRWQTISLATVPSGVEVRAPEAGPM